MGRYNGIAAAAKRAAREEQVIKAVYALVPGRVGIRAHDTGENWVELNIRGSVEEGFIAPVTTGRSSSGRTAGSRSS